MKIQRKQAVLGAVLVVAGGVWLADRASGGGPATATAAPAARPAARAAAPGAPAATAAAASEAPDAAGVARLLGQLASTVDRESAAAQRDAFAVSEAWAPRTPAAAAAAPSHAARSFEQSHQLSAVVRGGRTAAVVDGVPVAVGQAVGGMTLRAVSDRTATFEAAGAVVVLRLPDAAASR